MKLLKVDTLVQARERLLKAAKECLPETEQVALADASDRILAEDIVSGEMIPAFRRSSVDGYAVCSKDTAGATESIPVFLKVLEEVEIGHPAISKIEPGTCAYAPSASAKNNLSKHCLCHDTGEIPHTLLPSVLVNFHREVSMICTIKQSAATKMHQPEPVKI